jgi:hypothetical protein
MVRFAPDAGVVQRLKGLTVCTGGSELWRGSLSDRVLIVENRWRRFLRFTVAPDFEIRIGTAACASVGARYRFTRPGRGRGRPVVPVTGGRTWTQVRAPNRPNRTHAHSYMDRPPGKQLARQDSTESSGWVLKCPATTPGGQGGKANPRASLSH